MNPNELDIVTRRLGLLKSDVATIMGVTPRQVNSWSRGVNAIPRSVSIVLAALDNGLISTDWVVSFVEMEMKKEMEQ